MIKHVFQNVDTPSFIFDIDALYAHIQKMKQISQNRYQLCYSIKANPFLVPYLKGQIDQFEVCSPGEMEIMMLHHVEPKQILYSGVNKTKQDILVAMRYGVTQFTAESKLHMEYLEACASQLNWQIEVQPRLAANSQFGMSLQDIEWILENRHMFAHSHLTGLHYFVGTQRKKTAEKVAELQMLCHLMDELQQKYELSLQHIEYGPGFPVSLFIGEDFDHPYACMEELHAELCHTADQYRLTIEMGRYIATSCGYYVTQVMDIKQIDQTNYVIVDGGINHVNYYGQTMAMKVPQIEVLHQKDDGMKMYQICGSLCTTADILVRQVELPSLTIFDRLVFKNIGAYSITEGIGLFLSRTLPKVYAYKDGQLMVERDFMESFVLNCNQMYNKK